MRIAIISEEYNTPTEGGDGGLIRARRALSSLLPDANIITVARPYALNGFRRAWKLAMHVEGVDVRPYDLVISLSTGFAHGVIPGLRSRHVAYVFADAPLGTERGLRGHWYRFWNNAMALHVDHWIANSAHIGATLEKRHRNTVGIIEPPSESEPLSEERFKKEFQDVVDKIMLA